MVTRGIPRLISGEIHATDATQQVEPTVHGEIATEIDLARKEVVAQREAVIREASLISGQKLDVAAEGLETGSAGRGLPEVGTPFRSLKALMNVPTPASTAALKGGK